MATPGTTPRCWARHTGILACVPSHVEGVVRSVRMGVMPKAPREARAVVPAAATADRPPGRTVDYGEFSVFVPFYAYAGDGVAAIRLDGTLGKSASKFIDTSTAFVRDALAAAVEDPKVASVLLILDSPGGYVAGTEDLADAVRATNEQKPVVAYVEDLCCSAAYWVASQARAIYANAGAFVGSIGVFAVVEDSSKMAEVAGVTVHVISTGPLKGAGAPGAPITDEQLAAWQTEIDDTMSRFESAVRKGRAMTSRQVTEVTTGGTWIADKAKALGLIDGVKPLDVVVAAMPKPRKAKASAADALTRLAEAE